GAAALVHQLLCLFACLDHLDTDAACLAQVALDGNGPVLELVREDRLHRRRTERSAATRRRQQESRCSPRRIAKVLADQGHGQAVVGLLSKALTQEQPQYKDEEERHPKQDTGGQPVANEQAKLLLRHCPGNHRSSSRPSTRQRKSVSLFYAWTVDPVEEGHDV